MPKGMQANIRRRATRSWKKSHTSSMYWKEGPQRIKVQREMPTHITRRGEGPPKESLRKIQEKTTAKAHEGWWCVAGARGYQTSVAQRRRQRQQRHSATQKKIAHCSTKSQ